MIEELRDLQASGKEVLLVTSGAVGIGARIIGLEQSPRTLVDRQACAAAGQGALVSLYCRLMEAVGLKGAQILLTESDFSDRQRYLNLHTTLGRLLELGIVPIINASHARCVSIPLPGGDIQNL